MKKTERLGGSRPVWRMAAKTPALSSDSSSPESEGFPPSAMGTLTGNSLVHLSLHGLKGHCRPSPAIRRPYTRVSANVYPRTRCGTIPTSGLCRAKRASYEEMRVNQGSPVYPSARPPGIVRPNRRPTHPTTTCGLARQGKIHQHAILISPQLHRLAGKFTAESAKAQHSCNRDLSGLYRLLGHFIARLNTAGK